MKSIGVIGATGNIGKELIRILKAYDDVKVTAGVRDRDKAKKLLGSQLGQVDFDFDRPDTFEPFLRSIDSLFFIAQQGKDPVESARNLIKAAKKEGVEQLVFSSGRTTGAIEGSPLNQIEDLVKGSGINYTILRPAWFMQNFCNWMKDTIVKEDKFFLPAGNSKTVFVDVRDIASCAARCLISSRHHNQTYSLTSMNALNHYDVADFISRACGRTVSYVPLSDDEFLGKMTGMGWPEETVKFLIYLYGFVKKGEESTTSLDVQQIVGRRPITFEEFSNDYKSCWIRK